MCTSVSLKENKLHLESRTQRPLTYPKVPPSQSMNHRGTSYKGPESGKVPDPDTSSGNNSSHFLCFYVAASKVTSRFTFSLNAL